MRLDTAIATVCHSHIEQCKSKAEQSKAKTHAHSIGVIARPPPTQLCRSSSITRTARCSGWVEGSGASKAAAEMSHGGGSWAVFRAADNAKKVQKHHHLQVLPRLQPVVFPFDCQNLHRVTTQLIHLQFGVTPTLHSTSPIRFPSILMNLNVAMLLPGSLNLQHQNLYKEVPSRLHSPNFPLLLALHPQLPPKRRQWS